MKDFYEDKFYRIEHTFWLFVSRRDLLLRLLDKEDRNAKILELACSSGPLLQLLGSRGFTNLFGLDNSKKAINFCKKKGFKNVFLMDAAKTKFKNNEFDIIISSDLLEHIEDDVSAMKEWYRILKRGGKLIVFVPAFNFMWSVHDEINQHYRRYTKTTLKHVLKRAKFKVERTTYWNLCLFLPTVAFRLFQQRFFPYHDVEHRDHLYGENPVVNKIITKIIKLENILLTRINFPVGVSVMAIAKK